MVKHTILVLGAGFSKPLGGPLLSELLEHNLTTSSKADHITLEVIGRMYRMGTESKPTYNVEDLFTDIWREASIRGTIRIDGESFDSTVLKRELLIHLSSSVEKLKVRRNSKIWDQYCGFIEDQREGSKKLTIITFNYDIFIEEILDDLDSVYDYGPLTDLEYDDEEHLRTLDDYELDTRILKLHGSINWGICEGCEEAERSKNLITAFDRAYIPIIRRKRCEYCNTRFLTNGIIPPIVYKAGDIEQINEIWRYSRTMLKQATKLFMIGYSLPTNDYEAISLLSDARPARVSNKNEIICGSSAKKPQFGQVFGKYLNHNCYFEDYLEEIY